MNSKIVLKAVPRADKLDIEFVFTEPLSVEIKYRSSTAPPTLSMVKAFEFDLDWQTESPAGWSAASAFKKFLAEVKPQTELFKQKLHLAGDAGQNKVE